MTAAAEADIDESIKRKRFRVSLNYSATVSTRTTYTRNFINLNFSQCFHKLESGKEIVETGSGRLQSNTTKRKSSIQYCKKYICFHGSSTYHAKFNNVSYYSINLVGPRCFGTEKELSYGTLLPVDTISDDK